MNTSKTKCWHDAASIPNKDGFRLKVLRRDYFGRLLETETKVVKDIDTLCHSLDIDFSFSEIIGWQEI